MIDIISQNLYENLVNSIILFVFALIITDKYQKHKDRKDSILKLFESVNDFQNEIYNCLLKLSTYMEIGDKNSAKEFDIQLEKVKRVSSYLSALFETYFEKEINIAQINIKLNKILKYLVDIRWDTGNITDERMIAYTDDTLLLKIADIRKEIVKLNKRKNLL